MSGQITLRSAGPADAAGLATLHNAVWQETYRDLAPAPVRALLNERHRRAGWEAAFARNRPCTLALVDGDICGFVSYGAPDHPALGESGEIKHLYVAKALQGQGLGRRLLLHAFEQLQNAGFRHAALAVVEGNTPAFRFYAAMGGKLTGAFQDAGPLWKSDNRIISWSCLNPLPEKGKSGKTKRKPYAPDTDTRPDCAPADRLR